MATHLKIFFVTFLLLLTVMEEFKPVLAKKGERLKQRTKKLEKSMTEVTRKIKVLEACQCKYTYLACSLVSADIRSFRNILLLRTA